MAGEKSCYPSNNGASKFSGSDDTRAFQKADIFAFTLDGTKRLTKIGPHRILWQLLPGKGFGSRGKWGTSEPVQEACMKRMIIGVVALAAVVALGVMYFPTQSSSAVAEISVPDMMCQNCVDHVTEALTSLQGVEKAEVSLETKVAKVVYNSEKLNEQALLEAIHKAGYGKTDTEKQSCDDETSCDDASGCDEGHQATKSKT